MNRLDVLDSQIHIGPGGLEPALAAMNALGIRSVLIDEYWLGRGSGNPGYSVGQGAFRPVQPTAQLAALEHPDRFAYLVRVDRNDPALAAVIRLAHDDPGARALRITPGMWPTERAAFARGDYDALFRLACEAGLPVFIFAPGQMGEIAGYAKRFPALPLIIDHCGLWSPKMLAALGETGTPFTREAQLAAFDEVLAVAEHSNVAFKWAHAPAMFASPGYPGQELWPILRRTLGRFGEDRVMWASDASANQTGESWAELLFGVVGNPDLSAAERAAVLGATARRLLQWPA